MTENRPSPPITVVALQSALRELTERVTTLIAERDQARAAANRLATAYAREVNAHYSAHQWATVPTMTQAIDMVRVGQIDISGVGEEPGSVTLDSDTGEIRYWPT